MQNGIWKREIRQTEMLRGCGQRAADVGEVGTGQHRVDATVCFVQVWKRRPTVDHSPPQLSL